MLPPGWEITNKIKIFSNFLQEKCPYPKSEGWKWKQYFLSASILCKKGPLPAKNIKVSSVEINVNELRLPSEITYKVGNFTLEGWKQKQYFLSASASCQKGPLPVKKIKGSSEMI